MRGKYKMRFHDFVTRNISGDRRRGEIISTSFRRVTRAGRSVGRSPAALSFSAATVPRGHECRNKVCCFPRAGRPDVRSRNRLSSSFSHLPTMALRGRAGGTLGRAGHVTPE